MARRSQFPITIKAGGTAIKIYRSPQRVKVAAAGRTKVVTYDSFVVVHYRGGTRHRQRFSELALAQAEAARIRALLLNEDAVGLQLTGKDLLVYSQAVADAQLAGVPLDQLTKEYVAAKKQLGGVSLAEAVRFYERHGRSVKADKLIPEVVEELMAGLRADNKSDYHIKDMKRRLGVFAEAFPGRILGADTTAITEWLRNLKGEDSEGKELEFAPKTRNHYRNAVVQLFNFARDHGYLPKGMPTEAEAVKALTVVPPENAIFTVEAMTKLLAGVPEWLVPSLAIKAFSGVRTEELLRMEWGAFNFETKHITLNADVTKTRQRRLIPISDNLVAWLAPYRHKTGRICERWGRPQAFVQAFERASQQLGIEAGANRFRNSYISYRVAVTHDVQRVALESGNSPRVIQREYLELATEADGKRWFGILPPADRPNVTTEHHAKPKQRTIIRKRRTA